MPNRTNRLTPALLATFLAGSVALASLPAIAGPPARAVVAQNKTADEQTFREFEQIVADFTPTERIQAWEAFLQKYPQSAYGSKVREILSELKGEKPVTRPVAVSTAAASSTKPYTTDPDLDFLNDSGGGTPTPQERPTFSLPAATPQRTPTPRKTANASNAFLDAGSGDTNKSPWGDTGSSSTSGNSSSSGRGKTDFKPPKAPRERPPARTRGVGKSTHTEIAVFGAMAPDETYVRNLLVGMSATQRFGRTWGVNVEGYGAQSSETALLGSLRNLDAEPEVISKYNFLVGASAEANLLSAIDGVTGQIPNRNDIFVRMGGGIVNADLEICKQEGTQQCAAPLFINGVNFTYFTAGVGHRFFFTRAIAFKTEVRGRVVMELIDGVTTPRTNIQINLGPTFTF